MELKKVKVGKTVGYRTKAWSGKAKVMEIVQRINGTWVVVYDKDRAQSINLRLSQIL
jgi:hypothetical protein